MVENIISKHNGKTPLFPKVTLIPEIRGIVDSPLTQIALLDSIENVLILLIVINTIITGERRQ